MHLFLSNEVGVISWITCEPLQHRGGYMLIFTYFSRQYQVEKQSFFSDLIDYQKGFLYYT